MFNIIKGWMGERATQLGMWMKLDSDTYKRFHNLVVNTRTGTTQIDHVLLSRFGIFVIETKNYNGWIFGSESQKSWTQVLYGEKHPFQNPLHQNYRHAKALAEHLQIDDNKIHSIVFFIGDAELKTELPSNVMTSGLSDYIKQFDQVVFTDTELVRFEHELKKLHSASVSGKESMFLFSRNDTQAVRHAPSAVARLLRELPDEALK
ncbi:MAG: NERD domain-containing protein [Deltaproteobacteria bacterium]|nr:NERD domain-containing protein [Deltaproteobacteria bacterium]